MSHAPLPASGEGDALTRARHGAALRFAAGTTTAFVLCEAMGWYPSFLAPLLVATLLASLPAGLPTKAGVALVVVKAGASTLAFVLAALLEDTPFILFGAAALVLFACFEAAARGRSLLLATLVLLAFSTIPVVTMAIPDQAGALPVAFTRGMAIAVLAVWMAYGLWPERRPPPAPAPPRAFASPVAMAAMSCAILLPLMLVYLMFGITDALPLLITTCILLTNFEVRRSATQGVAMIAANLIGGTAAVFAVALLKLAPNLATLGLVTFLMSLLFGSRVARGGPGSAIGLVSFNQGIVLFSLALVPGGADTGLWLTRVVQFSAAAIFAVGMMALLLPRLDRQAAADGAT